ncbi:MmyB family transcriptional regulator [Streptomyces cellulosae]|uniref:MmyB-like transcription regulator ligand binding domain-containing protein n=1 Tax=Streptomyces cellulosae TaxID=1968 RepID=A0ABW7YCL5_STRCE
MPGPRGEEAALRACFHHPVAGDLVLDRDALTCGKEPDQEIVVWTAEPRTPSHKGLRVLASRTSLSRGNQA